MRVVVTGGRGFIGKHLIKRLNELGIDYVEFQGDVRKWDDFKKLKGDALIHLAAKTFIPLSFENPREFFEVNVLGTLNALEFCRVNKAKMIFISTYLYGKPQYLPIDEKHSLEPHSPYNESKFIGERLCELYNKNFGVNVIIFRQFNIYGPGQGKGFLVPSILEQLKNKEIILDDPEPRRDFTYVVDAVDAYVKALDYDSGFEIFNLGSGRSYSVVDIAETLLKLSNSKAKLKFKGSRRQNEIMETRADITKIKKLLRWEPKVDLIQGMKMVLKHER